MVKAVPKKQTSAEFVLVMTAEIHLDKDTAQHKCNAFQVSSKERHPRADEVLQLGVGQ